MSMATIEKIFSVSVFGLTFPNPTLVRLVHVKYRALTYVLFVEGMFSVRLTIGELRRSDS